MGFPRLISSIKYSLLIVDFGVKAAFHPTICLPSKKFDIIHFISCLIARSQNDNYFTKDGQWPGSNLKDNNSSNLKALRGAILRQNRISHEASSVTLFNCPKHPEEKKMIEDGNLI